MLALLVVVASATQATTPSPIEGRYWTADRGGIIEMLTCDDRLEGRILWRAEPLLDAKNPDEKLRGRSMIGVTFLSGFRYDPSRDRWHDGTVYSADNGRTYRGRVWLEDEGRTMKMRGFVGVSLLGRTATFARVAPGETVPADLGRATGGGESAGPVACSDRGS
ncbi:MAG: DUF2147 domain-containing protein [Pseudomonadota bacterium]